jgi:sortase A
LPHLRYIENLLLGVGLFLLVSYGIIRLHSVVGSRLALDAVSARNGAAPTSTGTERPSRISPASFSLWSQERIRAYEQSLAQHFDPPLGVLTIPGIGLEVPVFNGTDELTLNRGVGRIVGTGRPGGTGNLGIAGHRDGFFRGLKNVHIGNQIEFRTSKAILLYRISSIEIVKPDNVAVLRNAYGPSLTLVTCYPFYFLGEAPKRYIVHASLSATQDVAKGQAGLDARH